MEITKEESEAYKIALRWSSVDAYNQQNRAVYSELTLALRRHVAAEMKNEFLLEHQMGFRGKCVGCMILSSGILDPRHNYTADDWDRAAHEALMEGTYGDEQGGRELWFKNCEHQDSWGRNNYVCASCAQEAEIERLRAALKAERERCIAIVKEHEDHAGYREECIAAMIAAIGS